MKELFTKYQNIKAEIGALSKELTEELKRYPDFVEFKEELNQIREVYYSYKKKLLTESPALGARDQQIQNKRKELKLIKAAIQDNVMVVRKDNGEQLSLPFNI